MIYLILVIIPVLTIAWTAWILWRFHPCRDLPSRWTSGIILLVGVLVLITYAWVLARRIGWVDATPHASLQALLLIWAIVFLPFFAIPSLIGISLLDAIKAILRRFTDFEKSTPAMPVKSHGCGISRRQMLIQTTLAIPIWGTLGTTAISIPQKTRFRIRKLEIPITNLPKALCGRTITHVSDTHVGKFTHGRVLREFAEAVNELNSDLVLMTGDLIDHSIEDLPEALDMIERFNPGSGRFTIEGNHDLFDDAEAFVEAHRARGIPLLRGQIAKLRLNGHPIEIMGAIWNRSDGANAAHVNHLAGISDPEAFRVLLAHHPHAFDPAADCGIPLTLAGHTHGGQLMVTPEIGPGPMMYRYWSGLYRKRKSSLVVSNGAGNWFPLRTAAPAEILQLTLCEA